MSILDALWQRAFWWLVALPLADCVLGLLALRSPAIKVAFFRAPVIVQKLWPVVQVSLLLTLPLAPRPRFTFISVAAGAAAGLVALAAVLALWLLSFRAIGFIPSLRPAKGLISTGPCAVVQHPIHLGNLVSALRVVLVCRAVGAVLYWLAAVAVHSVTILVEKMSLRAEYGEAYAAYAKQVPYRLVPYVF